MRIEIYEDPGLGLLGLELFISIILGTIYLRETTQIHLAICILINVAIAIILVFLFFTTVGFFIISLFFTAIWTFLFGYITFWITNSDWTWTIVIGALTCIFSLLLHCGSRFNILDYIDFF